MTEAIAKTYGVEIQKPKDGYVKKTAQETPAEPQGLSFLDMQRRAAKEEGRLLDELLGRETEKDKRETAGEVLSRRQVPIFWRRTACCHKIFIRLAMQGRIFILPCCIYNIYLQKFKQEGWIFYVSRRIQTLAGG